jgi:hypothetical protein
MLYALALVLISLLFQLAYGEMECVKIEEVLSLDKSLGKT